MSVSVFANTLRTHSRLRVLTATRVTLPTTRCIGSLVAFRTAIPKNVSFSVSRSFTISQVARNELEDGASSAAPGDMLSNTIFAGNVPWRATEEDLTKAFEKFGEIKAVRIHMYQRGNSRGTCFIDFANKNSVAATLKSVAQEPIELFGRQLRVHNPRIENRKYEPNKKLYFSGSAGDESEIRKIFKQFNDYIVTVSLLYNPRTGKRSEIGFVAFTNIEIATKAMEALNGTQTPDGKVLFVNYSYAKVKS